MKKPEWTKNISTQISSLQSFHLPLIPSDLVSSHTLRAHILTHHTQQLLQPPSRLPSSANIGHRGPLHLYLSDALWILEAVLISSRGDIYCACH